MVGDTSAATSRYPSNSGRLGKMVVKTSLMFVNHTKKGPSNLQYSNVKHYLSIVYTQSKYYDRRFKLININRTSIDIIGTNRLVNNNGIIGAMHI